MHYFKLHLKATCIYLQGVRHHHFVGHQYKKNGCLFKAPFVKILNTIPTKSNEHGYITFLSKGIPGYPNPKWRQKSRLWEQTQLNWEVCTRGFLSPPCGLIWEQQKRLYYFFWPKFIHCTKSKWRIIHCQFNNIGRDGDTVNNNKKNWKNEMYSSLAHTRRCWYTNITVKITIIFNTENFGNL